MNISDKIKNALSSQDGEVKQMNSSASIYKIGTYKISKLFKNTSTREIENWANNILINLNEDKEINYNCECDFRICNDGNEKWNTGNLYIWVK